MARPGEFRIIETIGAYGKGGVYRHSGVIIQHEADNIRLSKSELAESIPLRACCIQAHALIISTAVPALEFTSAAGDGSPRDTFHPGRSQPKQYFPWIPNFEVL